MQIFILDRDPAMSARYFCDEHVRVMGREVTELLARYYLKHSGRFPEICTMSLVGIGLPYTFRCQEKALLRELENPIIRGWAMVNAGAIFAEYQRRFRSYPIAFKKWDCMMRFFVPLESEEFRSFEDYDPTGFVFNPHRGEHIFDCDFDTVIELYREYYADKLAHFSAPVQYTNCDIPEWLCLNKKTGNSVIKNKTFSGNIKNLLH